MRIELTKSVFSAGEIEFILKKLRQASEEGFVASKSENNQYLLAAYVGVEGKGITPKWNVKIYTYNKKKKGHSLVCVDEHILAKLLEGNYESFIPPDLQVLRIDDAGWGFPLCGMAVGVSNEQEVQTGIVPVDYFRDDVDNHFQTKRYLKEYTDLAIQLLDQFGANPGTHRIEICTGYVNQPLREELRSLGYDVRVEEIKGMLQNKLEEVYREYVIEEVGSDVYYDPKDVNKSEIRRMYDESLKYGKEHCPHKIKTGWNALGGA
jgi:ferredoxin-thioredoxin reductase catalytic subunit